MCQTADGGTTPCYNAAGTLIAPLVYLGRSVPSREGSVSTTLSLFRDFRIYSQVDFKGGSKKVDGNTRVRCYFFGGRCKENFFPLESDPVKVAQVQSNGRLANFLVSNSGFAKLRELSVSYTLPDRYARMANATRSKLLGLILVGFFSILVLSNIITALSTFFLARDLDLLVAGPVDWLTLYAGKLVETLLHSSWMVTLNLNF